MDLLSDDKYAQEKQTLENKKRAHEKVLLVAIKILQNLVSKLHTLLCHHHEIVLVHNLIILT